MNMVYLKSDCYGLLIKENELDCAQATNYPFECIGKKALVKNIVIIQPMMKISSVYEYSLYFASFV